MKKPEFPGVENPCLDKASVLRTQNTNQNRVWKTLAFCSRGFSISGLK